MAGEEAAAVPDRAWAVLAITLAAATGLKYACLGPDGLTNAEVAIPGCYSDVAALFQARGLAADPLLYREVQVEYPPLTGAQWWLGMQLTSTVEGFVGVITALGAGAAAVVLWVLRQMGVPPRRQLLWAASPALLLAGFVNFDLVPAALLALAVLAHVRGRDGLSGVLAGLGAAAKLYPGLLVPLVMWARLREGRPRAALVHGALAGGVFVSLNAALAVWAPEGWGAWIDLNRDRSVDWDTLWYAALQVGAAPLETSTTNALVAVTVVGGWVVIAWAGRRRAPSELWLLVVPMLIWLLVAGKVYSPQFSVWLLPVLVLTKVDARLLWAVLAVDAAVFLTRFPFLGSIDGYEPSLPYWPFGLAVAVRAVLLVVVIGRVVNPPAPLTQTRRGRPAGTNPLPGPGAAPP